MTEPDDQNAKEPRAKDHASEKSGGRRPHHKKRSKKHSQRGGAKRNQNTSFGPSRKNFREERDQIRDNEPDIPEGINIKDLDPLVRQDLRVLSKENAEAVAKHMIMAVDLLDDDPQLALRHARAAKNRAGRVGVVRESNGIVAYRAGEWKEALSELRAARRISGGPGLLAVMADCERGLGRPQKAIELSRSEEARELDPASRIELGIVVAGARRDLGQVESAVVTLERLQPSLDATGESAGRLSYAYADALEELGRTEEARRWFKHAAAQDTDGVTDAAERAAD
ncbi:hypothetical protein [Corynebacterium yudongzhengii]|nr:hypothetical protein [Corynebacterium yudongzhengii]